MYFFIAKDFFIVKKIKIFFIFSFMFLVIIIFHPSYAMEQFLSSLDFDVKINEDGSVSVIEIIIIIRNKKDIKNLNYYKEEVECTYYREIPNKSMDPVEA